MTIVSPSEGLLRKLSDERIIYLKREERAFLERGMSREEVRFRYSQDRVGIRGIVTSLGGPIRIGGKIVLSLPETLKFGSEKGVECVEAVEYPSHATFESVGLYWMEDAATGIHEESEQQGLQDLVFPAMLIYALNHMEQIGTYQYRFKKGVPREGTILAAYVTDKYVRTPAYF